MASPCFLWRAWVDIFPGKTAIRWWPPSLQSRARPKRRVTFYIHLWNFRGEKKGSRGWTKETRTNLKWCVFFVKSAVHRGCVAAAERAVLAC